jgi:hypothetical protein
MVQVVREGVPLRAVAQQFQVSPSTVWSWVKRSHGQRLDRVDFEDRKRGPRRPWNRTAPGIERRVLSARRALREHSLLGEYGAPAIAQALRDAGERAPSVPTIGRILKRHGQTDVHRRVRQPAPPRGWHLPAVAAGTAELDSLDVIEDLKLQDGPVFSVLTATSLHGRTVDAWPRLKIGAVDVVSCLQARWRALGLPHYVQFDNDARFQGTHRFADSIGRVIRLCLALDVTPVFVPPLEFGLQNAIEGFNGLWQAKVWQRFHFADLTALQEHSGRYVQANRQRIARRGRSAPERRTFPHPWHFDLRQPLRGTLVYVRRSNAQGQVRLLGHRFVVDQHWIHRLIRCEIHLAQECIRCYALRRRAPDEQPLLAELPYRHPNKPFIGRP